MVSCREEARATSTRVFRWNEELLNMSRHMKRLGFFALTTENQIIKRSPGKSDIVEEPPWIRKVIPFHLHHLDSRDSFQSTLIDLLSSTGQFLPETTHSLASQICKDLFYHYRFHPSSMFKKYSFTKAKFSLRLVIAVHVQRRRLVEFTSSTEEDDVDNGDLTRNLYPEELSDDEPKTDPNNKLKYSCDLIALTDVLKRYLGVRNNNKTEPILRNEPAGLVEEKPQAGLEIVVNGADGGKLDDRLCQICSKEFPIWAEIVKAACSHVFHGNCVSNFLSKDGCCPMCRFVLLKIN